MSPFLRNECIYNISVDEIDMGGVVYHANYLKISERIRNLIFAESDVNFEELWHNDQVFAVGNISSSYRKPIPLSKIKVLSELSELSNSTITVCQAYFDSPSEITEKTITEIEKDPDCLYFSTTKLVFASPKKQKSIQIPEWIRKRLNAKN